MPIKPHFSIELPVPTSTNALHTKGGKRGMKRSDVYKEWLYLAGHAINKQVRDHGHPGEEMSPYVIIEIEKPRVDRDIDNCIKAICDILVRHKLMADDSNMPAVQACWAAKPPKTRAADCVARVAIYNAFSAPALKFVPSHTSFGRTGRWVVVEEAEKPAANDAAEIQEEAA